jgi:methanethiol S-methyltransferase
LAKLLVLAFGVSGYLFGVSALVGWIVSMLGFMSFKVTLFEYPDNLGLKLVVSFMLMFLFALQHTIMARQNFKEFVARIIPAAAERSLFVWLTGFVLWTALILWPEDKTVVWQLENAMMGQVLTGIAILAWAYLFLASFAINHFELFGLQQVYNYFRGKETATVPFKERLMYKFDRHPIMTGAILGMWITPMMTLDHLIFSIFFSGYIVFGVSIEERDLIKQWGEGYLSYKKRVRSIVPTF